MATKKAQKRKIRSPSPTEPDSQPKTQRPSLPSEMAQAPSPTDNDLQISPVDRWNLVDLSSSSSEGTPDPRPYLGWMKDAQGEHHRVLKVMVDFRVVRWRARKRSPLGLQQPEQLVSPKSMPGVRPIVHWEGGREFKRQRLERGGGEDDGWLDPEFMPAFYPGLLRLYS